MSERRRMGGSGEASPRTIFAHDIISVTEVKDYDAAVLLSPGVSGCRRDKNDNGVYGLFSGLEKHGSDLGATEIPYVLCGTPDELRAFRVMLEQVRREKVTVRKRGRP